MIKELLESKSKPKADASQAEKLAFWNEIANTKAEELVKLPFVGQHSIGNLTIEIESFSKIDGGIELFARVFENGNPVGFGADGSVEIERFRIFNPPVLVSAGTKHKETKTTGEEVDVTDYIENPEQAILESLAQTIKITGKGGERIQSGKRGNTTSTFYSASVDCAMGVSESATWSTVRNATSGFAPDSTDLLARGYVSGGNYSISRGFVPFDTSALPDGDAISSATFSLWAETLYDSDNDGDDYIAVVQATFADPASPVAGDFDQFGTTKGATDKDITGMSTGVYSEWTLNATGLGWISKTGTTQLGVREGHDLADNAYSAGVYTGARFSKSETAGTTQDPKLVVEHAAAGPANIKTYNTNLAANIKTINTNPIANVKSLNTNT